MSEKSVTENPDVQRLIGQVVKLQAENKRLRYGIEILKTIRRNIKAGAVTAQWIGNFIDTQALQEKPND